MLRNCIEELLPPLWGPLHTKSYGHLVAPDPTGSSPIDMIEIFDVHPGDCSGNKGWNDRKEDRERSEILVSFTKRVRTWFGCFKIPKVGIILMIRFMGPQESTTNS